MKTIILASVALFAGALTVSATPNALDQMAFNGGAGWGRTPLDASTPYNAISGDGGEQNQVYAAQTSGGISAWGFDKAWSAGTWAPTSVVGSGTFTALTRDATRSNIVFGARSTGGIVQYEYNGTTWNANVVDNSSRVYTSLTYDSQNQNKIYGASSSGLYEVTFAGGWNANLLTSNAYSQVSANGTNEGLKLFGLNGSGNIDSIYFQSGSGWLTAVVDNTNTYSTIVGDGLLSNKVYGARTTGGINELSFAGGWVSTNIVGTGNYTALANRDQTGNNLYGSTSTGEFNEIAYGGAWNSTTLFTGQTYNALVSDGARDPAIFGVTVVPEPSTVAYWGLAGIAAIAFRMRRRAS